VDNAAVDVAEKFFKLKKEKADELRLDSVEYNNLDDRQREILETNFIMHCGCHVENLYGQAFTSKWKYIWHVRIQELPGRSTHTHRK
jgi:hypothetical protein